MRNSFFFLAMTLGSMVAACANDAPAPDARNEADLVAQQESQVARCGGFAGLLCGEDQFCAYELGDGCGFADALGTCKAKPDVCSADYEPVCGCNRTTYSNECQANAAGVSIHHVGPCDEPQPQPTTCGGWLGELCGDGEYCSYEPEARCGFTGAQGVCKPKAHACPANYDPVCGCNGETYSNACAAGAAGFSVLHHGPCEE